MKIMADYRVEALDLAIKWNRDFKVPASSVVAVADLFERYICSGLPEPVTNSPTKELLVENDENVS